jgi:uncharacterized OB-fold protein
VTRPRVAPELTADTEFFWRSGADGQLRVLGCRSCSYLIHPPAPYCPECGGRDVEPRVVSGRGVVYAHTVVAPTKLDDRPEYVVAVVELAEQADLRMMTNIVGCAPVQVRIGMPVHVVFEPCADLMIPLFEPTGAEL